MDVIKSVIKSFWHCYLAILMITLFINLHFEIVQNLNIDIFYQFNIKLILRLGFMLFLYIFSIIGSLASLLVVIWTLVKSFYYSFFYEIKNSRVFMSIDESNVIQESFVELANGKKIPIDIRKIITKVPSENSSEVANELDK